MKRFRAGALGLFHLLGQFIADLACGEGADVSLIAHRGADCQGFKAGFEAFLEGVKNVRS